MSEDDEINFIIKEWFALDSELEFVVCFLDTNNILNLIQITDCTIITSKINTYGFSFTTEPFKTFRVAQISINEFYSVLNGTANLPDSWNLELIKNGRVTIRVSR